MNGAAKDGEVEQLLLDRNAMMEEIRCHLKQAQDRMKLNYDRRSELQFKEGDFVFLRLDHTVNIQF